jgi:recombinational DNA repair protein RecR
MKVNFDVVSVINQLKAIDDTITKGTIEEVIAFAKQYNIHQESTNEYYLSNVKKIKARLTENAIDWETI